MFTSFHFHLLKNHRTQLIRTKEDKLAFSDWGKLIADEIVASALLGKLAHQYNIVEPGDDSNRFKNRS